ncbi:MAG: peptide deformylase [Alphaproteobacteria bacterium]|nr:MAG: peptide deformylase [Alphaproteobacteria bacterium]
MSIKPIITIPDPILREVSRPVERIDAELLRLLDDMLETMYDAPGIGLAGIQVGVPLRIVTIDVARRRRAEEAAGDGEQAAAAAEDAEEERDPLFLINPVILARSDERSVHEEGCLSIPEYYAEVERPAACTVSFLDRDGRQQLIEAQGILATCLQHEVDHLDGRLFIDYLSRLKRDMVIKRFTKAARQNGAGKRRMVG